MPIYCPQCGTQNPDTAQICQNCRYSLLPTAGGYQQPPVTDRPPNWQQPYPGEAPYGGMTPAGYSGDWKSMGADKKMTAGICAILLGAFGVHKFILGYKTEGLILLLSTLLTCFFASFITVIIGLVEGIIY